MFRIKQLNIFSIRPTKNLTKNLIKILTSILLSSVLFLQKTQAGEGVLPIAKEQVVESKAWEGQESVVVSPKQETQQKEEKQAAQPRQEMQEQIRGQTQYKDQHETQHEKEQQILSNSANLTNENYYGNLLSSGLKTNEEPENIFSSYKKYSVFFKDENLTQSNEMLEEFVKRGSYQKIIIEKEVKKVSKESAKIDLKIKLFYIINFSDGRWIAKINKHRLQALNKVSGGVVVKVLMKKSARLVYHPSAEIKEQLSAIFSVGKQNDDVFINNDFSLSFTLQSGDCLDVATMEIIEKCK